MSQREIGGREGRLRRGQDDGGNSQSGKKRERPQTRHGGFLSAAGGHLGRVPRRSMCELVRPSTVTRVRRVRNAQLPAAVLRHFLHLSPVPLKGEWLAVPAPGGRP